MKYTVGVLGLLLLAGWAGAEPEQMQMYATLSAPIGSFWKVETKTCESVVMPSGSQLNLGSVATDASVGSTGGEITVQGTEKPLTISKLRMEKGTTFQVSNNARWMVSTLKIAPGATFTLNGDLIVNKLTLENMSGTTTLTANVLRLGQNATITGTAEIGSIQTGNCGSGEFCLNDSSGPTSATWSRVTCSKNENNNCSQDTYWLVGG